MPSSCEVLVPDQGSTPSPLQWKCSLNQSTTREFPAFPLFIAVVALSPSRVWLFCDPTDCSLPGSFVHGISQARILEQVAISFSRGPSWSRDQTHVSCIGRWILYSRAIREALDMTYYLCLHFSALLDLNLESCHTSLTPLVKHDFLPSILCKPESVYRHLVKACYSIHDIILWLFIYPLISPNRHRDKYQCYVTFLCA